MSKLNYNNIDVQRLLNVLSELYLKFKICSFISYQNLEENLDEISKHTTNEELLKDLKEHYDLLKKFREKHIIIQEEDEKIEINEDEDEYDENKKGKDNNDIIKERKDLIGIEENTSEETKELAKNCRKLCRKYYRDQEFLKLIDETKKAKGADPDIEDFIQKFSDVIVPHYQKKTKMTLEEEESETHLNAVLRQKINDLQDQIQVKTAR